MPTSPANDSPPFAATPGVVTAPSGRSRGLAPAGFLVIVLLWLASVALAFQSGAYSANHWLPALLGVAALAFVAAIASPAVSSTPFQKLMLGLLAAQAAWTAASVLWADSLANVWQETNRTLLYAVAVFLVFAAVRWAGAKGLTALSALLTVGIGAVAVTIVVTLAVKSDPESLFLDGRLEYPITYFNGLASLLMVGFWLALSLATAARRLPAPDADTVPLSRSERRVRDSLPRWTQPLLLLLGVVFLQAAQMTQSRGALWAFFLVVPLFIIFSPHRFRALVDLAIVVLPVVLFWDKLNGIYLAVADQAPLEPAVEGALLAIAYSAAIVLGAWLVTWLVERLVGPLGRKARIWIGVVLLVLAIFGAAGGVVYADMKTGGLDDYLVDRWTEFTSDSVGETGGGSRFAAVGLNGRLAMWKIAAKAFAEEPALGLGAQNYEHYFYLHRTTLMEVRQPHSQPMQLLSELGVPGVVLWLAFVLLVLVWALIYRFRTPRFQEKAVVAAVVIACISWFIHSSADWLWQLAGVTLPAMLLFGGLIALGPIGKQTLGSLTVPGAATSPASAGYAGAAPATVAVPAAAPRRSGVLRSLGALLALIVLASAALPYLSLRFSDVAAGSEDLGEVATWTNRAAALDPTSVEPFAIRAGAHLLAAEQAPSADLRLEQLLSAAAAWEDALEREPGYWLHYYQAAEVLVAARDVALTADAASAQELGLKARTYLAEARRLNPLSPEIGVLEEAL